MGDILHALPAVTALRKAHPGWVIDWVVEPRWRALLAAEASEQTLHPTGIGEGLVSGHDFSRAATAPNSTRTLTPEARSSPASSPGEPFPAASTTSFPPRGRTLARPVVDSLLLAPTRDWRDAPLSRKTLHEIRSLRHALKAGDYDTVIDLQGALRSAVLGRMASCQRLIGEAEPRERAARWLFTEQVETRGSHVIEQDVELASAVAGDDLNPAIPWLPVDPAAEAWADSVLPRHSKDPAVLLNPGAGWGAKRWPVECYAEVAGGLLERGWRVLVNAGPGEEPLADGIANATGGRAETIVPTLGQLIALTRRIALCIAGDTGPLHLACALGRPVVGIYGPTDPSRNGPFGTRFKVLRSPDSRRDHTRHATPESGLMTIRPQHVLQAADELFAAADDLLPEDKTP
jgi:heptosyltransferase I